MGSGTNLENIIAAAHDFHKNKYNKKSNFEKHWNDLKRHPKWRQPKETSIGTNGGNAKRTKLSDSGNYSSSMNKTPTNENVVESPVCPKGTKAAKRKGKGKAEFNDLKKKEYEEIKASTCRRLDLMAEFNELKKKEEARKENKSDMQLLMLDTSIMNEAQREIYAKMIEEVKSRRGWN
ncbi:uncharacterized protein LOC141664463 [Apium graveolens]|uniref:uncharacterized protein LOC141664463 n=1 Tax=Apium graveolens TaxID=4045 RepID=UPI003D7A1D32